MKDKQKPKDWKITKFLKEKAPDLAGDLLNAAGSLTGVGILKDIGKKIQNSDKLTPEEKEDALLMIQMQYNDVDSARRREIEIAKTSSGWLVKNIVPLIAISWTIFTFVLYIMALSGKLQARDNMQILVINSITNIIMLIVGYYFGSSKGSKDKSNILGGLK